VGDEDGHLGRVLAESERDLLGGQHQPARRVKDQVDRNRFVRELDRAQEVLRVLNVDEPRDRETEEAHRLLAMDQPDHATAALLLEPPERPDPLGVHPAATNDWLE